MVLGGSLCCDKDDAVCRPVAIDGRGCGIFKYRYLVYKADIQGVHVPFNAIYQHQGLCTGSAECTKAPDTDCAAIGSGFTSLCGYGHACRHTLKGR